MEENELEEGEACDYSPVDPDSFSYIDEKIQDVLGHFQKEFDGEMSAEQLGAKWGGYGSFLPAYKRSPSVLSQTRSPPKVAHNKDSISPSNPPNPATIQNGSVVTSSSISTKNISKRIPLLQDTFPKKESLLSAVKSSVGTNSEQQKALKVRIKVGSDNNNNSILRRNNAAIYSGLGLNISPSSSCEYSSDGSGGIFPESCEIPGESPTTILQTMTSIHSFPCKILLSPITSNILQLTQKIDPPVSKNTPATCQNLIDPAFPVGEVKEDRTVNRVKPNSEKKRRPSSSKSLKADLTEDLTKSSIKETKKVSVKEKLEENMKSVAFQDPGIGDFQTEEKPKLKPSKIDKISVETRIEQKERKGEMKEESSIIKAEYEESKGNNDQFVGIMNSAKNNLVGEKVAQPKHQQYEEKRIMKREKQAGIAAPMDYLKDETGIQSSNIVKERKKDPISKSKKMETVSKIKSEQELSTDFKVSHRDIIQDPMENGSGLQESKDRQITKKTDKIPISDSHLNDKKLAPCNTTTTTEAVAAAAPVAPMEIKENWVGCDKCEKWRLLPYGKDPGSLPKKWRCSMLDWLPAGMNKCEISEEETTAALNAYYMVPLTETVNAPVGLNVFAAPSLAKPGLLHPTERSSDSSKRKRGLKDRNDLAEHSYQKEVSNSKKKKEKLGSVRGSYETNSFGSGGAVGIESKSADFTTEKQKHRNKNLRRYSDGGDFAEKTPKHLKNKRLVDPDDLKASKRMKREDTKSESFNADKSVKDMANISSFQAKGKASQSDNVERPKGETREYYVERSDNATRTRSVSQEDRGKNTLLKEKNPKEQHFNGTAADLANSSSSSKVSGSRKNKPSFHETKGSPVESVSSSPLRVSKAQAEVKREAARPDPVRSSETKRSIMSEQDKKQKQVSIRPIEHQEQDELSCRKPGKSSSSRSKEKQRIHKVDFDTSVTDKQHLVHDNKQEQNPAPQTNHSPLIIKESKTEVNNDQPKAVVVPQSRKVAETANGAEPNNILRQATPNPREKSPLKRESHSAAYAILKEARSLKHTADRLKSEGSEELECTGLYFEAALKFLHAASLWEPVNSTDTSRQGQGEANQAKQIYSDTAKLCEFCAHAYERCKKMALAALAFKCVEVAYLKAAFYKHPTACKDRHELQTTLQMVQLGESPSSSASDIDNLNNHGLAKLGSAKDSNSPQVAGNHVIAARNHPHMMRLLAYTNDLNCAFEATRKSQIAFAAASAATENSSVNSNEGLASVKKVLDFSFNNVRELLRLVHVSMESFSR